MIEAEALAVHLEDVHMVGETGEQRSGESFRAEGSCTQLTFHKRANPLCPFEET